MEEVKPNYSCTQEELYSLSETIVDNAQGDLTALENLKSKYDGTYIDARRDQIQACRDLPDEVSRTYGFTSKGFTLNTSAKVCTDNFQTLKRYIDDWTKDPAERKAAYNAAGQAKYLRAVNDNWEEVGGLNSSMITFVTQNDATLQSNGYMPSGFLATITADKDVFKGIYNEFKLARETSEARDEKVTANNELYKEITLLADDGKFIFRNDDGKQKRYTISALLTIISPPGAASLFVRVKRDGVFTPVAGATIKIQKEGQPAVTGVTDANGEVTLDSIDAGVYTVAVKITGEPDRTFTKEVNVGTKARMEIVVPEV